MEGHSTSSVCTDVKILFVVPLNQLFAQHNFSALHFDQFLVVIVDDCLF